MTATTETLLEKINELEHRLETVERNNQRLRDTVETLEDENDRLRDQLDDATETIETLERTVTIRHDRQLAHLEEIIIGEDGILVDDQEAHLAERGPILDYLQDVVHTEDLHAEQQTRSKHDAKLERKLAMIADETDVELTDTAIAGEDKLQRLLTYGPEDIADRVYNVHHRARDVLAHATSWGQRTRDKFGERVVMSARTVKEKLGLKRDETLSSTEVRRVFEKLEQLAADSPRRVRAITGGSKTNKLVISLRSEETTRRG
ncbi:hypothetical protein SAMN04487948_13416 [Halogranum amylolyticum]|uniref:Uncharacterized protein n=1 Tax=Halogranum amylolyticum TaxID=660520 RepID=A0A1H8WNW5_9EURY|nr:hypothetical protein [Halogranum amylolyticum]SEP28768.1 hypothetical protein SAMN04487948_13416 [Halogranum amylolyticum]